MNSQSLRDDSSKSFNEVEDIDKEYTRSLFSSIESGKINYFYKTKRIEELLQH